VCHPWPVQQLEREHARQVRQSHNKKSFGTSFNTAFQLLRAINVVKATANPLR